MPRYSRAAPAGVPGDCGKAVAGDGKTQDSRAIVANTSCMVTGPREALALPLRDFL